MRRIGFDDRWASCLMSCKSLATYFVLINGESNGNIRPTRRLRQGDPFLNPNLFLLCVEGLTVQLKKAG